MSTYIAPAGDALDFWIGSGGAGFNPPLGGAVHVAMHGAVTITGSVSIAFEQSIKALTSVDVVGVGLLDMTASIAGTVPPAGPGAGEIFILANAEGDAGQPATAAAILGLVATATGFQAVMGTGGAGVSLAGAGSGAQGVAGTSYAILAMMGAGVGSTTDSVVGVVDAPFDLRAYGTGRVPQVEVCA